MVIGMLDIGIGSGKWESASLDPDQTKLWTIMV